MKIALLSVSTALAASAALLSTFGPAVVVSQAELKLPDIQNVSNVMLSVTSRDPNIMTTELKGFVPPKKSTWLDAKASDIDPLFMRSITRQPPDDQIAGITKMGQGGGSGGITYSVNGGGSCIDHLKAGRFVEGGSYVAGAQSETSPWGKNLSS